jgi:twinkle protein
MSDSKVISRESCPDCGSKDNVAVYDNGGKHCFTPSCSYHVSGGGFEGVSKDAPKIPLGGHKVTIGAAVSAIHKRSLSESTCKTFGVTVEFDQQGNIDKHFYPFYHPETGELIASKVRNVPNKAFYATGDLASAGLFGQNICRGRGKYITITEGELDALSVYEMFGQKFDVVSLKAGASSAEKEIKANLEFLEGYDNIVLCFDNDKAGNLAVEKVKDIFSPNKLKICKLPMKDASEMLVGNKITEFTKVWWDAKVYRPDGIVAGEDTWDALVNKRAVKSTPYPWEGLNTITKGHRPYELVTITSGSGMGKSQFIRELEYDLLQRTDANIGVLALEEDVPRTTLGIMSVAANRPLHLEEDTPVDQLRPYWESTLGTGRYYLFDHWGSTSTDNLLSRVRYMAKALDCKYVILDHLSIVVSGQENGDERKAIDEIMTKLRTLVAETGIGLFLVSHLKRVTGKAHEDGGNISLQDLRGSQSIAQLSDIVIGMERNQQHEDLDVRNTTCVRILKNRYTGQTGPACWLRYETQTGRMLEVPAPNYDTKEDEF